jgi:ATPase family associated with various cellular activities (AAA)
MNAEAIRDALSDVPYTPAQHLKLALFGVVARIAEVGVDDDVDATADAQGFLTDYVDDIENRLGSRTQLATTWRVALRFWEASSPSEPVLPLLALARAGLTALELELLLAAGLIEEDPRFGAHFERAQGRERRPTFGLLLAWWREGPNEDDRADEVRVALQGLVRRGLLVVCNPEAPRLDWALCVPLPLWDALRGDAFALGWLRLIARHELPTLDGYIATPALVQRAHALPTVLRTHPRQLVLLRGPAHNGRKALAGAVAQALGQALLVADETVFDEESRWSVFGALATVSNALPVIELHLAPGQSRVLPAWPMGDGPLVVVTGQHGTWACADGRPVVAIDLPLPAPQERMVHWDAALPATASDVAPAEPAAAPAALSTSWRMGSGQIRRVAHTATALALLAGRAVVAPEDLRQACRTLQAAHLETLATRLPAYGQWHDLSVDDLTREELDALLARCRWRETLAEADHGLGGNGVGVRALLAGNSGTGKTLAARLLAAELGKDVYRVDLAATVNKYIGETEKNLDRAFTAAEQMDVVLLLDEGDALMASRTDVASSNDRYANMETNFLLQRIESFEGILLITSNAADRIDKAFARRMDVVIHFRPPDEWRRYDILKLHLAGCEVDDDWLQQAACRCALSGGQWRNVASHARLLALDAGVPLQVTHLYEALAREYRKTGANCPLRPAEAVMASRQV